MDFINIKLKIYMKISKLVKNKSGPCLLTWILVAVLLASSFGYIFFKFKEGMATCTDNADGTTTCVEGCTTIVLYPDGTSKTTSTCLKSCDLATSCDQCLGASINGTNSKCYWSDKKKGMIKGKDDRCSAFQDNDHTRVPCDQRDDGPKPSPWPHPDINPVRPDPDDHDDHHNWPNPTPGPKPRPGPGPNPGPGPEPAPSNCPSLTMLKGPVFINSSALPLY
jgi:hypothetical protein